MLLHRWFLRSTASDARQRLARRRSALLAEEGRVLLRLAGPITLSQLGGIGMNTMDTIMVGPLGPESLAAAGLAGALHMAVLLVCTGMLLGMGPLVSQSFGARNRLECRRVFVGGLWLGAVLAVPVFAVNLVGERMSLGLGQEPVVAELAGGYMFALAWGVLPIVLFFACRQFIEGLNLTRAAMVMTFLGLAVNYVGNRILIYGVEGWVPAMGVVGSGWSTTIVRWSMLAAMVVYLVRHRDLQPLTGIRRVPQLPMIRRIASIGWPAGLQVGLEVALFSGAAVMMGWFGAVELGSHQVTINIAATTFMVALGVSIAGSIRVGQLIGADDPRGARRAVVVTYALSLGFMGICALVFLAAPEFLIGLYTREPEILRLGSSLLLVAALFQLFDGAQVAAFSVLRGAADTRVPMVMALLGYWVLGLPCAYLLGFHTGLGPVGVWIGLCFALAAVALLLGWRVRQVLWARAPRAAVVAAPAPPGAAAGGDRRVMAE
jgi:multidrug resistance protein, MATE family